MGNIKKYVYLFELDSVRKSDKEIKKGQNALLDEIIYKGNTVVLTFNQFVESRGFYILLANSDYKESLLNLFKKGLIKINRYSDTRTISQYLINSINNTDDFVYSAIPIEFSQKRLLAMFKRSLIYSDLSEVDYYLNLINKYENGEFKQEDAQKNINKIIELFFDGDDKKEKIINYKYKNEDNNIYKNLLNRAKKIIKINNTYNNDFKEEKEKLKALKSMLQLIFELSLYDDIYIDPIQNESQENQYKMIDYIDIILNFLPDSIINDNFYSDKEKSEIIKAIKLIKNTSSYKNNKNNRSTYVREIINNYKDNESLCRYALGIIDLCYNFTCENSIANISRHYDYNDINILKDNKISNLDIENNSFIWDFKNRLKTYIEDSNDISLEHRLQSDYSMPKEKGYFKEIVKKIKLATNLNNNRYFKTDINNKIYSYEYKEKAQLSKQISSSIFSIVKNAISILIFYYLSYITVVFLKTKITNLYFYPSDFLASSIGLFLIDFIRKIASKFLSNFITIDDRFSRSLTDTVFNLMKESKNLLLFTIYYFRKRIYSNLYNIQNNKGIDAQQTKYIEYIIPKELKDYKKWYNNKKDLKSNYYKIVDFNDDTNLEKIIKDEEIKNIKYGLIYSSDYRKLIIDPIQDENNNLFPYERIIPNNENGVVMMVKHNNNFVLLNQFRHPIREKQICFPRGFCESESLDKDVIRELNEELKINKEDIIKMEEIGIITPDSGLTSNKAHIYYCEVKRYENSKTEGIENIIELSNDEFKEKIKKNYITDGFTISAYCLAKEKNYI